MGNIMICGTLCESVEVGSGQEKDKNTEPSKPYIDQILIKEIFEREQLQKTIDREMLTIKESVNNSMEVIKQYCSNQADLVGLDLKNTKVEADKSISNMKNEIDRIKNKHISDIEKNIAIMRNQVDNIREDIQEIKDIIKNLGTDIARINIEVQIIKNGIK